VAALKWFFRWSLLGWFVIAIIVGACGCGGGSNKNAGSNPAPAAPPPSAPKPKPKAAHFVLVVRESSCQESPGQAYINCSIGVRNRGGSPGLPNVWVQYRYDDSGTSLDSYQHAVDSGVSQRSDPIPPHQLGFVYFSHSYNAREHDVIQAAATLDENDSRWPYIRVANPNDVNWPDG
jgi:hypothetical protein